MIQRRHKVVDLHQLAQTIAVTVWGRMKGEVSIAAIEADLRTALYQETSEHGWFAYDDETGFDLFNTEAEAISAARTAIDEYQEDADGEWPEAVESVCWGTVLGVPVKTVTQDEDGKEVWEYAIEAPSQEP